MGAKAESIRFEFSNRRLCLKLKSNHQGPRVHLALLVVIAHDSNAARAKQVLIHQLLHGLHVRAEADANEMQVRGSWAVVAALQVARRPHSTLNMHSYNRSSNNEVTRNLTVTVACSMLVCAGAGHEEYRFAS